MANPTVAAVIADAQAWLGDPNGTYFTAAYLTPYFNVAFRDLYTLMLDWNIPFIKRDAYYLLPSYTNILYPASIPVTDLDQPKFLWERGSLVQFAITAVSNTTPVQITAPGHTFGNGFPVTIQGTGVNAVNGITWDVTPIDGNNFTLNGSIASGSAGAGGFAGYSGENFVPMFPVNDLPQTTTVDQQLRYWKWQNDTFQFTGSTQARQVWIQYDSSGVPPVSGGVGIDNAQDFLSHATAGKAAATEDMQARSGELLGMAYGPNLLPDGTGGFLRTLVNPSIKEKQKRAVRRQSFRPRRNNFGRTWL